MARSDSTRPATVVVQNGAFNNDAAGRIEVTRGNFSVNVTTDFVNTGAFLINTTGVAEVHSEGIFSNATTGQINLLGGRLSISSRAGFVNSGMMIMGGVGRPTLYAASGLVRNDAVIRIAGNAGIESEGSQKFSNRGTISIDPQSVLTLQGPFVQETGSIEGANGILQSSARMEYLDGVISCRWIQSGGSLRFDDSVAGTVQVRNSSTSLVSDIPRDVTIQAVNNSGFNINQEVVNHGRIYLTTSAAGGRVSFGGDGLLTNAPDGLLEANSEYEPGPDLQLRVNLVNQGTLRVNATLLIEMQDAKDLFSLDGGTIEGNAPIRIKSGATNLDSGVLNSLMVVESGKLTLGAGLSSSKTIYLTGRNPGLGGTIAHGVTVQVAEGNRVNIDQSLTNHGVLAIRTPLSGDVTQVSISGGKVLENASDGLIDVDGILIKARISGNLVNAGRIRVMSTTSLEITGQYTAAGGQITGPHVLRDAGLRITADPPAPTTLLTEGTTRLLSDISESYTLAVRGKLNGISDLISTSGFANRGVIRLLAAGGASSVSITVTNGTLLNSGRIEVPYGFGGSCTIDAAITSTGALIVDDQQAITLTNNGRLSRQTGGEFHAGKAMTVERGTLSIDSPAKSSGYLISSAAVLLNLKGLVELDGLDLGGNGVVFAGGASRLVVKQLEIRGLLNLNDNSMVFRTPPGQSAEILAKLSEQVSLARRPTGSWTGQNGITSSSAASDQTRTKGLVVVANNAGVRGFEQFAPGDVIVAFTWNGDVNLDQRVDIDDFLAIDRGFLAGATGPGIYNRGDFNFDSQINMDDYNLIDNAFLAQT
jgi:hypothetical protein